MEHVLQVGIPDSDRQQRQQEGAAGAAEYEELSFKQTTISPPHYLFLAMLPPDTSSAF